MRIIKCLFTQSNCYKAKKAIKPVGLLLHSTGANNTTLKRYCQPSKDDAKYDELMKLLGDNKYDNDWNRAGLNVCVHSFIGKLADGSIATVEALPHNIACWGCGRGSKGSYNYNPTAYIQVEVCEDNLTDKSYFNKVYREAVEYFAHLCKELGLTEKDIVSHAEAHKRGYASNHGDIDHWLKRYGLTMDDFRAEVAKELNKNVIVPNKKVIYRVQVGAFSNKAYAEAMAKELRAKGYQAIIKQDNA